VTKKVNTFASRVMHKIILARRVCYHLSRHVSACFNPSILHVEKCLGNHINMLNSIAHIRTYMLPRISIILCVVVV
jgi:hypothetical protein